MSQVTYAGPLHPPGLLVAYYNAEMDVCLQNVSVEYLAISVAVVMMKLRSAEPSMMAFLDRNQPLHGTASQGSGIVSSGFFLLLYSKR